LYILCFLRFAHAQKHSSNLVHAVFRHFALFALFAIFRDPVFGHQFSGSPMVSASNESNRGPLVEARHGFNICVGIREP
jgi:hypothetical protein